MSRLSLGQIFPTQVLTDITGRSWPLPPERLTHLQLRRFAGCPICNMHMISLMGRIADIEAAGIQELVVFNSTQEALAAYATDLPFPTVPDPERALYNALGVTTSSTASLAPKAMASAMRGMLRPRDVGVPEALTSTFLLPADFLIAPSGEVLALHYGTHASDQWTVDELLAHAERTA